MSKKVKGNSAEKRALLNVAASGAGLPLSEKTPAETRQTGHPCQNCNKMSFVTCRKCEHGGV